MTIKNKVFGFVAAAALTLGMVGGAAAQSTGGSAWLDGGSCKITITSSWIDYGSWIWDGDSYELVGVDGVDNQGEITFSLVTPHGSNCNLSWTSSGLSNGTSNIPPTSFSHNYGGSNWHTGAASGTVPMPLPGGNHDFQIKLQSVPSTATPGGYNGTMTFTLEAED